jgi:hypothetical protein
MAASQGYGKAVTSGSVFAYDVADTINSFKGQPKTNLLTAISKAGVSDSTFFKTNSGTEIVNIPNIGNRTVHYVNIYNDYYGGSGNCCPSLMYFGDFSVSPSTVYTYQIIYKTTTGYAHPNYMYHYEFNGGTYVTEYGLWDSSRQENLGDGWAHAWGTFTSNASTNRFITYLFHYEYGVWNKIQVAGIMLTQGNNIIPPRQFLDINETRSATQGLLPLVGNSTLDLSNVSFDSSGQIMFDGSDDRILTSDNLTVNGSQTLAAVVVISGGPQSPAGIISNHDYANNSNFGLNHINGDRIGLSIGYTDNTREYDSKYTNYTATVGVPFYVVMTFDQPSNTVKLYINGTLDSTFVLSKTVKFTSRPIVLGRWDYQYNYYYFNGKVYTGQYYNRALTEGEVKQNYNKYKTRFNLS